MRKQKGLMTKRTYNQRALNGLLFAMLAGLAIASIFLFLPSR